MTTHDQRQEIERLMAVMPPEGVEEMLGFARECLDFWTDRPTPTPPPAPVIVMGHCVAIMPPPVLILDECCE